MERVQITTPGIKKALRRYKIPKAIAEFVWNGFDAQATRVDIIVEANEIGFINQLRIVDNGYGIPFEQLDTKFTPFFESEKEIDPDIQRETSAIHGKNGVGRLTFFTLASVANWQTVYQRNGHRSYKYEIEIQSDELETYYPTELVETAEPTGTVVTFEGIQNITAYDFETGIAEYLIKEFGWFLELKVGKDFSLRINEADLDYSDLIGDRQSFQLDLEGESFQVRYVRWNKFIHEYSRYYFIDSTGEEKFKKTTTLNNKGDHFYHSVYIQSSFFDHFVGSHVLEGVDEPQGQLFRLDEQEKVFAQLMDEVDRLLREKRRPFLRVYSDKVIEDFRSDDAFPVCGDNEWDRFRREELENVVRELFQLEPRIFSKLNTEQKKTLAHLLDLIIDSGERDRLINIIDEIVTLEPSERAQFAHLLQTARLSNIIKTIKLIEDRYRAIDELNNLVFNQELRANEPDHIQKFIEGHYWIFGEQYHLLTAEEPKFEEALRRFLYVLRGQKEKVKIDHPDKNREMDIFMVRRDLQNDRVKNVVIELKNPRVRLGEKELNQVKRYMRVISKQPEFNASNIVWDFILVGNSFDTSGYLEGEIENSKHHGERSLVYKNKGWKIYVRTWSEVLADFEIRHKFLNEKLQLQRCELIGTYQSPDDIIASSRESTAVQSPEIEIPD